MLKFILPLFVTFLSLISLAHAQTEKISNFISNITINKNSSIDITETISVYSNGDKILHGIVRRLPLTYTDLENHIYNANYKIIKVLANGHDITFHTEKFRSHLNIYIGNLDTMLTPGAYVYTLQYRVQGLIHFLPDKDTLFLHLTGEEWDFPIMHAEINLTLPHEASILTHAVYIDASLANTSNYVLTLPQPYHLTLALTQILKPATSLNLALTWPAGIIKENKFFTNNKLLFINTAIILGFIFVIYSLSYMLKKFSKED